MKKYISPQVAFYTNSKTTKKKKECTKTSDCDPFIGKNGGKSKKWLQVASKRMEEKGTKGKFSEYCGGKVTNECISKGLKSPNKTIRKRALFAKNVRSFQFGGLIPYQEGVVESTTAEPNTTSDEALRRLAQSAVKEYKKAMFNKDFEASNRAKSKLMSYASQIFPKDPKRMARILLSGPSAEEPAESVQVEKSIVAANPGLSKKEEGGKVLGPDKSKLRELVSRKKKKKKEIPASALGFHISFGPLGGLSGDYVNQALAKKGLKIRKSC